MSAPGLRPLVLDVKQRLIDGRERIRRRHERGSPGIQVCRALTELVDSLVLELYRAALVDLGEVGPDGLEKQFVLTALGGTGRQDLAPYSDVDLMLLHEPAAGDRTARLAERLMRDVFDVGLQLGHSVRTAAQACAAARDDATICTSLVEARRLTGSEELFASFRRRFARQTSSHAAKLLTLVEAARGDERNQYGETVYLLEPNIKRSRGGLRDIQFIRWVGFLKYGTADPDGLRLRERLTQDDYEVVSTALEFLLRIRNEMHFHAGKGNDLLDKAEQMRLAALFEYPGNPGQVPVEQFMQDYFRLTSRVNGLANRFLAAARDEPWWSRWFEPLVAHRFEDDYRVGPRSIGVRRGSLAKMQSDLGEIVRLFELANLTDKPIDRETVEAVRAAAPALPDVVTQPTSERFIALLSNPARLGELLRVMHDCGVLEKLIPDFAHARCLLQFNEYHKFTVDEHTLRAVEHATRLVQEPGALGQAYRGLKRKWMLHLALLVHDLGKGYVEDHSEVGRRIAAQLAERLHLSHDDGETLKFLVHKHLMMSHLAFRRDTSDEQLLVKFAVDVGSPEVLQMLFVLTACDLAAVGPGTLNAWKTEVLADLYARARERLTSDDPEAGAKAWVEQRRGEVRALLSAESSDAWFARHVDTLPRGYLLNVAPQRAADDLQRLRKLGRRQAAAQARYVNESRSVEYWVGTYEDIVPGVFHRLTGALTSQGLQILSAEINTLDDGLIIDRFWVQDPDYAESPPADRLDDVCRALVSSIEKPQVAKPTFRRTWGAGGSRRTANLPTLPTRVLTDNGTSDHATVIEIFAADRRGLLYTITRTLFEMELSVNVAKIGTYIDQVVDVFYVVDRKGKKIESQAKLNEIRTRLLVEIEAFERREAEQATAW